MSDRQALLGRFNTIMSIRPGETEDDARRRRKFVSWHGAGESVARLRRRAEKAHAFMAAHGVDQEDQVAMIRASLPAWVSWLAAEVVHGRKPAEISFWTFDGSESGE